MSLVDKLNAYIEDYWDFANYREKSPIIQYPAKMVTPMQRQLLNDILEFDKDIHSILDPFMGSGTVLSVGQEKGLDVIGYDINPLAVLISRVRLEGVPSNTIRQGIDKLQARIMLMLGNVENYTFTNIEKWFREDIIQSLSLIRAAILEEKDIRIRRFFWCCFAETVKRFSNTRTSTFKLHIKEEIQIESMENNCIEEFMNNINTNYIEYCFEAGINIDLKTDNSFKLLSECDDNSMDLICTSPPYGDNHTTVTYGQYSILPLLWINTDDLDTFDKSLLSKFTAIDRESLGGRIKGTDTIIEYKDFLNKIDKNKQKKIISFWYDYEMVFEQMARILKPEKLLVLTLGNRRVNNQELPFDNYNDFLAQKYGLKIETTLTRKILGKRMPLRVSHIAEQGSVKSMSKEYIKIYRKQ